MVTVCIITSLNHIWHWMVRHQVRTAGITIEGDNKWLTLMQNAVKYQKAQNWGEHH